MELKWKCKEQMPRVAVLMSAYNGEKYIQQQIDSILMQTYENVVLYVRDDGSSDHTLEILKRYEEKQALVLLRGDNLGYINSFFHVMKECENADYYAWCDQDDIWIPEKIERAVKMLETDKTEYKNETDKPVLYFSSYDYYDESMHYQKKGLIHPRGPSFSNSLMDCIPLGFNSVFNHEARRIMEKNIPQKCCGHDWWTYMICAAFGRVIYDRDFSSVKYRRLEQSVSPGGKSFIEMQVWRFKKFFVNDYFAKIREQLREFGQLYGNCLDEKDKKVMALFVDKHYSLLKAVKKCFYPVWFRQGMVEELMVRVLFLTGKL